MHKFYLYYSGIAVLVCLSAAFVFSSVYRNVQGAIWAFLAALVACQCFVQHFVYFSNKLHLYHQQQSLSRLKTLSFIIVLLSSTFLIWYTFTMVYWKIPLLDYERTPLFSCVFSFITGKWGLHLYTISEEYANYLANYSPITQTV